MLYYMSSLHEKSQVTDLQQQTTKNAVCFFLCLMMILTCSSVAITAAGAAAAAVAIIDIVLLIGCYILLYICSWIGSSLMAYNHCLPTLLFRCSLNNVLLQRDL